MKFINKPFFVLFLFIFCSTHLVQSQIFIRPDKPSGIYEVGDTVTWYIQKSDTVKIDTVKYTLKNGGLHSINKGIIQFNDHKATITHTFKEPGAVLLDLRWNKNMNDWDNKVAGGAIASIDKLKLSSEKPSDFDEFWTSKIKELQAISANPILNKGDSHKEGVDYWKIKMDNIRGSKIHGQLAKPVEGEKFPALLIVQWAGVYPFHQGWITNKAKDGWLVLNINPHDLPIDNDEQFYEDQSQNELKNYWNIGNDNRDTSYFLRMYLSCYRAAQYLSERPDWNGETLVVMGTSQGGQQAIMTAGFHPAITAAMALVPAGFDNLGPKLERKGGWPQWYINTDGKDAQKVHETSKYYDVANFVTRIKCPVLVGVGLLDNTCPPEGILAGLNQLTTPKEIIILSRSSHQDKNGSQRYYRNRTEVWLKSFINGKKMLSNQ